MSSMARKIPRKDGSSVTRLLLTWDTLWFKSSEGLILIFIFSPISIDRLKWPRKEWLTRWKCLQTEWTLHLKKDRKFLTSTCRTYSCRYSTEDSYSLIANGNLSTARNFLLSVSTFSRKNKLCFWRCKLIPLRSSTTLCLRQYKIFWNKLSTQW